MSTLTEQFSAVRKSQLETQLNFFQSYTTRALDSAQKIIALNLNVSRASLEKSSAAMVDLMAAQDPRDLFALTKRTQESLDGLLAYNRELIAIATGAGVPLPAAAPEAKALPLPLPSQVKPAADLPETAPAAAELVAPVAAPPVEASVEPVEASAPVAPPEAKAKPIAKAVGKVAAKPAAAPIPAADTPVVVSGVKPVDASPPAAAVTQQQLDLPAAKTKKKK